MSSNIVFEGWLTKSPPSKRIWRTKWRRRWFALRQSCELPGQYFLDYYADRNCRRLKGTINLDLCEQVDAGLHMARAGNGTLDPKLRGSVFTIQTQSRTYHLEADCEADMAQWVDAICKVCGLRPAEDESNETYQNTANVSRATNNGENVLTTGPYIPISECITGVRNQDQQRAFTFESGNVVSSTQKTMCDKSTETCGPRIYIPPQIKITTVDSENESNGSDEDSKSLSASQTNIPDWQVTKSFTKLAINNANKNEVNEDGPPVPPRPPKTFAKKKDVQKETFQGPKIQEPVVDPVQESIANYTGPGTPWLRVPRRITYSPVLQPPERQKSRNYYTLRHTDDDDFNPGIRQLPVYDTQPEELDIYNPSIQHMFVTKKEPEQVEIKQPMYRTRHDANDPEFKPMYRTRHDADDPEIKQPMYRTRHDADDPEIKQPMYRTRHDVDDPEIKQPMYRTRHDANDPEIKPMKTRHDADDPENQPMYRTTHDQKVPEIKQPIYRTKHDQNDPEIKQPMYRTTHGQKDPEIKQPMCRTTNDQNDPEIEQPMYKTTHDQNDPGIKPMDRTRHDQNDPEIKHPICETTHDADDPEIPQQPTVTIYAYTDRPNADPYNPGIRLPESRTRRISFFFDNPRFKKPTYVIKHECIDPSKQPTCTTKRDQDDPEVNQPIDRTRHDGDDPAMKQSMYKRHDKDDPAIPQPVYITRHDEDNPVHNTQYCNLPSLPPAVDRALKPRHSSHSIGHINNYMVQDDVKPESLQYLDLDLQSSAPSFKNAGYPQRLDIIHGKSYSGVESECVYKTVDFLKTEAFNMTRQDAEAFRSHQY